MLIPWLIRSPIKPKYNNPKSTVPDVSCQSVWAHKKDKLHRCEATPVGGR